MSQNGKLLPNLDQHSTKALNLTVLQRIDPSSRKSSSPPPTSPSTSSTSISTNGVFTVFELFSQSRKDVEGSLFVVKRNTQPRFQFIVMNRRNTDNLVEDLLGDFEYEVQVPYLLYRNAAQEVNGIWFTTLKTVKRLQIFLAGPPKPKVSSTKSEFEELEAVPSLSVIEGPLEPPTSSAATPASDVPDDSFLNFFSQAISMGSNASNPSIAAQPRQPSPSIPLTSHAPSVTPSPLPPFQPSASPAPSTPPVALLETNESSTAINNRAANLVKPSFFSPTPSLSSSVPSSPPQLVMPPISASAVSASVPTAPPLHPPVTMQRPYGAPLLQPFPPPTPPPSLTPAATTYGPVITRDKVREALAKLVQDDHFIDIVYREILDAHQS
uniref:mRNA-decapping enzyme-like protein n=1 Tax=Ananas comosus var. bracteatus TaxID=296719 RepID=A0A6V7Q695_ANACO|nr:unnamed protein product [Ananas comosus var. bracteatus]